MGLQDTTRFLGAVPVLIFSVMVSGQAQVQVPSSWTGYQQQGSYGSQQMQQPFPQSSLYNQQQSSSSGVAALPSALHTQSSYLNQQQSQASASSSQQTLQMEPQGQVTAPDGLHSGIQLFKGEDTNFYVVDWSYPRSPMVPYSILLKEYGAQQPPEYVAMYRLRGPASSSQSWAYDPLQLIPGDTSEQYNNYRTL